MSNYFLVVSVRVLMRSCSRRRSSFGSCSNAASLLDAINFSHAVEMRSSLFVSDRVSLEIIPFGCALSSASSQPALDGCVVVSTLTIATAPAAGNVAMALGNYKQSLDYYNAAAKIVQKENLGIGLKTFLAKNNKTLQKITEFGSTDRELYENLSLNKKIFKIAELRNERISFRIERIHGIS